MSEYKVSLCIPTNGIIEWVIPVLDSIYMQGVDENLYEVVVTNNGNNEEFHTKMLEYASKHPNLVYKKTDAYMFYNQLEALKLASGEYLKFVNHRAVLLEGALQKIIDFIDENRKDKPVIYFSNGQIDKWKSSEVRCYSDFDGFIAGLGRYISWTTGVGIWKEQYDALPSDMHIDSISPHSCILLAIRNGSKYIINNMEFSEELEKSHEKKGKYDLFKAFGVEEVSIALNLYIDGDIKADTFKIVKKDYERFLKEYYWTFCIRKLPCSYKLDGFDDVCGIFYNKAQIVLGAYMVGIRRMFRKIFHK